MSDAPMVLEPGEIFGVPAVNAVTRQRDTCWADVDVTIANRTLPGECHAGAVKEGLCAEHYRAIFGRAPDRKD